MIYREETQKTESYKKAYISGIEAVIDQKQKEAELLRTDYFKDVFSDQDKYRRELKQMLGWPLVDCADQGIPSAAFEKLSDEGDYTVFRVRFEILNGLTLTGLFFKMHGDEKKPLVIVQHGGGGTPEKISGIYDGTANYNDMLMRVAKHDVHVFAPQLLLWGEQYGIPFDRKDIDARLKRVGSSITAIELYGISKIIDYFEGESYVSGFGMVGLSYGGFYTLFAAAIDTRIKSAISCSFFNKRDKCGWSDWVWSDSAKRFDDAEVACLVYPRRLCIEMGDKDELFDSRYSEESFERIKDYCKNVGSDWVELVVFDGTHEFCKDDAPIERLINDLNY